MRRFIDKVKNAAQFIYKLFRLYLQLKQINTKTTMKAVNFISTLEEKGIEISKQIIRAIAVVISGLLNIDANKDGKVDLGEGSALAMMLFQQIVANYANFGEFIAEIKDVDSTERKELITVFREGFDMSNDEAEQKVEQTLVDLEEIVTRVSAIAGRFKKEEAPTA